VNLSGHTCVVSGASRGLGLAIAEHLASRDADLALCARTASELDAAAAAIRSRCGVRVLPMVADVADELAVASFARTVEAEFGSVFAVINNAGILGPVGSIHEVALNDWRAALSINVLGVAHMIAAFVPLMATSGGSIINLSGGGIGGTGIQSHLSAYTTSKGAIAALTETIAAELAPLGIRINAIAPGALPTQLMKPVLSAGPASAGEQLYEAARRLYETAEGRVQLDEKLAGLIDLLLDDSARGLTGRILSARWDSIETLRSQLPRLAHSSLFTLRRIDGHMFVEHEVVESTGTTSPPET